MTGDMRRQRRDLGALAQLLIGPQAGRLIRVRSARLEGDALESYARILKSGGEPGR